MEPALLAAGRFMVDKVAILVELDEKLKAITGIKGKMEKLKELSTNIDMVIQDVESHPSNKDAIKDLLRKLKYLAYDLEDVADCYDTDVLRKQRSKAYFKPMRDFFSSNNQVAFKSKIGGMIKAVRDSLDSILLQKSILLNLPQGSIRTSESNLHGETHSRTSFVVIGRETEKNMIVNLLTDDDGDESSHGTLKVIAIVGMGGLGKTTLAQLVFNDEKVKAHFASSRMWKVVGAEFDPKRIMKSVLELATHKPVSISEIDLVRQELETILSEKKFLLVLDDVWNENASNWDVLKAALTCGARGSKVLVTTRSLRVSSIMGSNTTHQIQQLSRDDCLSLFQQSVFGDEAADQKLMEIGGKIVEKCGGVPLAAKSLGSMLHSIRDEIYWSSVLSSTEIWQLRDEEQEEQKVLAVLKWSYDALPLQSKKCFAFGSLFPKNYMMKKDELIQLWIANGLIHSKRNFDAETEGNSVFNDLVLRSFFLLSFQDEIGCTMHDLMHDLARSVSADAYWNSNQDSVEDISKRTYHLQIFPGVLPNDMFSQVLSKKPVYLRTFMSQDTSSLLNVNLLDVFSKLKFLRVLDLRSNNIKAVPTSIGNLIHLRYLNLSWNNIEVLPDSITLLLNLQYLYCNNLRLTYMPRGLSRLINLQCLPHFAADNRSGACSITELEDLKLRGEMMIKFSTNFSNYSCGGRKILKNKHLSQLSLLFNYSENNDRDMLDDLCPNTSLKKLVIANYGSRQFPTWLMELQLSDLVEVSLRNCRGCEHIPPFGNLQFLKKLDLYMMNDIFTQMGAEFHGHGGFPSLQELCLSSMYNLEEWSEVHPADQPLFPLLQKLRILRCPKLKCMPWFPRIQELEISYCNRSLLSCIGRLTSLSVLRVEDMYDITSLPSDCIRNLTSLTKLKITECKQLQHLLDDEMQCLETIRSLTIYSCNSLTSFPSEVERLSSLRLTRSQRIAVQPEVLIPILNSLQKFRIEICGKKINLSGQLQRLHTLRKLLISGKHSTFFFHGKATQLGICCCDELESLMVTEPATSSAVLLEDLYINEFSNLTVLPEWLQQLKSLRILSIRNCQRLERVPRGLKDLHMLRDLRLINCPQLEGRCERETGEDWSIISHVAQVTVSQVPRIRPDIVQQV